MGAVLLPIVGLMICITLIILFFSKKHVHNKETKIYSKLLLLTLIFLIIGLLTFVVAKITNDFGLITIFQKVYMTILVLLNYYSIMYCISIFNIDIKKNKKINIVFFALTCISIFLVLILPLNVIFYDNVLDGEGPSYDATIAYSIFCYITFIILTIYLLLKKDHITKIMPFLILILLYLIGFILRNLYPELIFEGFFYSFILLIMYHTIENPDLKMLKQLQLSQNQMEKSNKIKSEFLSSMSHEIRTPLNAIVGYSELIEYANTLESTKEYAKDIVKSSKILLNMYSNLLDLYKLETNNIDISLKEYNPKKEFDTFLDLFEYRVKEKKLNLIRKIDDIPDLIGDISLIKRAILNIIDNSIKYTFKGSITFEASYNDKEELIIIIEDTGSGIKKEKMKQLFINFERLDYKDSSINGMGLGLSLSKNLIELIGGDIKIESSYGKGTKVIIKVKQETKK